MPRVVVKGGVLIPVEPLPADFVEGVELNATLTPVTTPLQRNGHPGGPVMDEADWMDDEDYRHMVEALAEADRIEKERMHKEMGLT